MKNQTPIIEKIEPHLFRVELPLPNNPLQSINSYIITGERNLVVDTAFNLDSCYGYFMEGISTLGVDLTKSDFLITHMHPDHAGLVHRVATPESRIYFSHVDATFPRDRRFWAGLVRFARSSGLSDADIMFMRDKTPGYRYDTGWLDRIVSVGDGDTLEYSGYRFRCIETPGHTMGHICLYEPAKEILMTGDHILMDITPNVTCWLDGENPLAHYFESLRKIDTLNVRIALPGHRRLFTDHHARIRELECHHRQRLEEVVAILKGGPKTAAQVAAEMAWDIDCASWEAFPAPQKWFATGEALAHIRYLEEDRTVRRTEEGGVFVYSVS